MTARTPLRALAAALALVACDPGTGPCDGDQRYLDGLCYDVDDAGPGDAGAPHFGDPCGVSVDCLAPTNFCVPPSATVPAYCTRTGCLTDPTACPAGWPCVDLGVFQPQLPSICARP
jgi:hypothetical protein